MPMSPRKTTLTTRPRSRPYVTSPLPMRIVLPRKTLAEDIISLTFQAVEPFRITHFHPGQLTAAYRVIPWMLMHSALHTLFKEHLSYYSVDLVFRLHVMMRAGVPAQVIWDEWVADHPLKPLAKPAKAKLSPAPRGGK